MGGFDAAQRAIRDLKIEILAKGHATEDRNLILDRVRCDGEDPKPALSHGAILNCRSAWMAGPRFLRSARDAPAPVYPRFAAEPAVLNWPSSAG